MNWLRFGGVVLLAAVSGCTSASTCDDSPCNPFWALGRDIKAIGPAVTDTTGLQHDAIVYPQAIADSGPGFLEDILRIRDVLFAADCEPGDKP